MALFKRGHTDEPESDPVGSRLVIARLDAILDRQEAVYELLVRALKPISPVEDDPTKGQD